MALCPMEFDSTSFEEVTFSDLFDTSYKSSFVSSVTGAVRKMKDSSLYIVNINFTLDTGNDWAVIGRFKKTFSPRIISPTVHDDGTIDGSFWSSDPSANTTAYKCLKSGLHHVNFMGSAT